MANKLMSIREAASKSIERLRRPNWANPLDHVKIDLIDAGHGPWAHLWCPFNMECNGRDPVDVLLLGGRRVNSVQIDPDEKAWVAYAGPLSDSDEYRNAVAQYSGTLSRAQA